jgi:hypothetical protein
MQKYIEIIEGHDTKAIHSLNALEGVLSQNNVTSVILSYLGQRFKCVVDETYDEIISFLLNKDDRLLTLTRVVEHLPENLPDNVQSILPNSEKSS